MKEWFDAVLSRIGIDGLLHILVSALLMLTLRIFAPVWVAVMITAVVGIAKEVLWDLWYQREYIETRDLICDAIGIAIGCMSCV